MLPELLPVLRNPAWFVAPKPFLFQSVPVGGCLHGVVEELWNRTAILPAPLRHSASIAPGDHSLGLVQHLRLEAGPDSAIQSGNGKSLLQPCFGGIVQVRLPCLGAPALQSLRPGMPADPHSEGDVVNVLAQIAADQPLAASQFFQHLAPLSTGIRTHLCAC